MEIREFQKKDTKEAISFAVEGMDFRRYTTNPLFLRLYAYYFWYLEWSNCTRMLAAYEGDRLMGVLMADMKGEPKQHRSFWKSAYVQIIDFLVNHLFPAGQDVYTQTNQKMYQAFEQCCRPDGEIRFLAVRPHATGKGIGSLLLSELEKQEPGKRVYLYTDDGCTYPFYDAKGFERCGDESIEMDFGTGKIPVRCFLYTKQLAGDRKQAEPC